MRMQKEMVESFQLAHKNFIENLGQSLDILEHDIEEASELNEICTGRWCQAVETSLDELAKYIYAISEPRWVSKEDSVTLHAMRERLHDMYAKYKGIRSASTH